MMYSDIVVPSEGDGSTFTLVGQGYYRGTRLASLGWRLLAFGIDYAFVLVFWVFGLLFNTVYYELTTFSTINMANLDQAVSLLCNLLPWAAGAWNVVIMQSRSGQSLGKMLCGMSVVCPKVDPMNVAVSYFVTPDAVVLGFRAILHAVDLFLCIGAVSIVMSKRNESIADKVCNTMVIRPLDPNAVTIHKGLSGARDR